MVIEEKRENSAALIRVACEPNEAFFLNLIDFDVRAKDHSDKSEGGVRPNDVNWSGERSREERLSVERMSLPLCSKKGRGPLALRSQSWSRV